MNHRDAIANSISLIQVISINEDNHKYCGTCTTGTHMQLKLKQKTAINQYIKQDLHFFFNIKECRDTRKSYA